MSLLQFNSITAYSQGVYQASLNFSFFPFIVSLIQKRFWNYPRAIFPQPQMVLILEVLVYLTLCNMGNQTALSKGKLDLLNNGCPRCLLSITNCVPKSQYFNLNPLVSIEFDPANNAWMSVCETNILNNTFRDALISCYSYFSTVRGEKDHWKEKAIVPTERHSFELTNSFSSIPSALSNASYYSNSKDFKCNYSNFCSLVFGFCIVAYTSPSGRTYDVTNWNTFNKANYTFQNIFVNDYTDTLTDLLIWYFGGNSELRQKVVVTTRSNTQKQSSNQSHKKGPVQQKDQAESDQAKGQPQPAGKTAEDNLNKLSSILNEIYHTIDSYKKEILKLNEDQNLNLDVSFSF